MRSRASIAHGFRRWRPEASHIRFHGRFRPVVSEHLRHAEFAVGDDGRQRPSPIPSATATANPSQRRESGIRSSYSAQLRVCDQRMNRLLRIAARRSAAGAPSAAPRYRPDSEIGAATDGANHACSSTADCPSKRVGDEEPEPQRSPARADGGPRCRRNRGDDSGASAGHPMRDELARTELGCEQDEIGQEFFLAVTTDVQERAAAGEVPHARARFTIGARVRRRAGRVPEISAAEHALSRLPRKCSSAKPIARPEPGD